MSVHPLAQALSSKHFDIHVSKKIRTNTCTASIICECQLHFKNYVPRLERHDRMSAFRQKCHSQHLIIPDKFQESKTMSDDVEESQDFFYERFPLSEKKTQNSHS
jgi:hypothetical protein